MSETDEAGRDLGALLHEVEKCHGLEVLSALSRIFWESLRPLHAADVARDDDFEAPTRRGSYWPYLELLRRTFGDDILVCRRCGGAMKLLALVTDPESLARYLRVAASRPTRPPGRPHAVRRAGRVWCSAEVQAPLRPPSKPSKPRVKAVRRPWATLPGGGAIDRHLFERL